MDQSRPTLRGDFLAASAEPGLAAQTKQTPEALLSSEGVGLANRPVRWQNELIADEIAQ